jgi:hypothetical protein
VILLGRWKTSNGKIAVITGYYEKAKMYEGKVEGQITFWSWKKENLEDPSWDLLERIQ